MAGDSKYDRLTSQQLGLTKELAMLQWAKRKLQRDEDMGWAADTNHFCLC